MSDPKESDLSLPTVAAYSSANFGINMVNAFSNFALPLYLAGYGLPAWLIGVLSQERSSLGGVEQPLIGLVSDRTRSRLGKRRPFFLIGALLVVASLIFLSLNPPLWLVIINLTLFASFLALANDPYQALMADLFPVKHRGKVGAAVGLTNMAGQVVFLLLAASHWETNQAMAYYIVGFGMVASFAITVGTGFLLLRRVHPEKAPDPAERLLTAIQ